MMKRARLLVVMFLIGLTGLLALSCGGGGSSSGGGSGSSGGSSGQSPATIDQAAAGKALGMAMAVGNITDSSSMVTDNFGSSANVKMAAGGINIVKPVLNIILHPDFGFQPLGSVSEDFSCSDSGTGSVNFSWTGPDSPSDCSEASNMGGSFIFNDCVVDGVHFNGQISFSSSGSACNPDSITVTYTNFLADDPDEGVKVSAASFTIVLSDFIYSGDELVGMKMLLNGSIEVTTDGQTYNASCNGYTMEMEVGASETRIRVNGSVNGPCLDGWVTLETVATIVIRDGDECPSAGQIKVSGNGEANITFNSDGSVDIESGDGTEHYTSCSDLNQGCN